MILVFSPEQVHKQAFDAILLKQDNKSAAKPSAENFPQNLKKACRSNNNNNNNNNNKNNNKNNKAMFQPCRKFNQAARVRRQANNQKKKKGPTSRRIIEQRTPIHRHKETPDAAKMSLDVTGFAPEDITIQVRTNHVLSIQGKRTNKLGDVFVIDRRFRLNKNTTTSIEHVTTTLEDGILELTVTKKPMIVGGGPPRRIPIVVVGATPASSSHTDSDTVTLSKEEEEEEEEADSVAATSAEGVEDPHSKKGTSPEENQEQEFIAVEMDHEDKATIEEVEVEAAEAEDDKTSITNITTKKSAEDEAWETVNE